MAPDLHSLTGAYSLDALDDEQERRDFEQHLAACPDCWEEVRTLRETVAVLAAATAVPPPARMRARVLAEVAATRPWPPRRARPVPDRRPRLLAAAAALVLVAGVGFGGFGLLAAKQARDDQLAAARRSDRIVSVLADPASRRTAAQVAGGGRATLVLAGSGAVVVAVGVDGLPSNKAYQLWILRGDQVRSAGLGASGGLAARPWNRLVEGVRAGDQVAISVEPASGSPQPTTAPVAVLRA